MFGSAVLTWLLADHLDKYDRKSVLVLFLLLRGLCLIACGFATTPIALIILFTLSGSFTGPASSVLMAAVIDVTPPPNRGRVMAFIGSAFSIAAILMVPLSLLVSLYFSWQINFWIFGGLGLVLAVLCVMAFPTMTSHIQSGGKAKQKAVSVLFAQSKVKIALLVVAIQILAHFLIISNFSAYFQFNLSFPREHMSALYFGGGAASFIALQFTGKLFDKGIRHQLHIVSALLVALSLYLIFIETPQVNALFVLFALMMTVSTVRMSATTSIISHLPSPPQRAAFMSINNSVSNVASGAAGFLSAALLTTTADNKIVGMDWVAMLSIFLTVAAPLILWRWVNHDSLIIPNNDQAPPIAKR
ncbi:MFS transporter [Psychromonas sp. KJ10-2]|uniref:MFS transporter n=1 Tax=Psychromonas sp. KJ10-2 TaxID=3391822 RepID=UPI0039B5E23F